MATQFLLANSALFMIDGLMNVVRLCRKKSKTTAFDRRKTRMNELPVMELNDLIDGQKVRIRAVIFLFMAALALVADGYDLSAIGYVGPELVKSWHIVPAMLAPVFSAGIFGLLFGAPVLGSIGDRIGRKKIILIGLCTFGCITLLTMAASSLAQFMVLRFITGVGLGGVIPNVGALASELSPKRLRGMFIVIVNFGVPVGIILPGFVAACLVPHFGWPILLFVGGILPIAVAIIAFYFLPESIKYLAERGDRPGELRKIAHLLRPELPISEKTQFVTLAASSAVARGSSKTLFTSGLAIITPLIWIVLATNQMSNFFSLSWLPMLLQSTGSNTSQAGISVSLFSIGGLSSGFILLLIIDRLGVVPLVILFFFGTPLIAAIGMPGLTLTEHRMIIAGAGFCVKGINFGTAAIVGMIYPTSVRSMAAGWAQAAGRVGALAAPIVGGVLLEMHFSMQDLMFAPAFVMSVGTVTCATLAILCARRFDGFGLSESSAASTMALCVAPSIHSKI